MNRKFIDRRVKSQDIFERDEKEWPLFNISRNTIRNIIRQFMMCSLQGPVIVMYPPFFHECVEVPLQY